MYVYIDKRMSSSSNYDTGSTPVLPSRNVVFNNVRTPTAQITNLSVSLINGVPPPTAPPIVAPVGSILSVTSPGTASFSSDVDILGNIDLAGNAGSIGQYIKKTGASTQDWSTIDDGDIAPGLANQVMTTNSTGTESKWSSTVSVDGDLVFNGIYGSPGQFVVKSAGSQLWRAFNVNDIPAGSNNQVLTTFSGSPGWNLLTQSNFANNTINSVYYTNALGVTQVGKLPIQNINQGSANQLFITNSLGTLPTWTSTAAIPATSITFNADANQTPLNYFNEVINDILPITYEDGTTGTVDVSYQAVGKKISIRVNTRSVTYASISTYYRTIGPIPAIYRPGYGIAPDYSDYHSECFPCEQSISGFTSGAGYIGFNGLITIFTSVDRSAPAAGTCTSYTHTFNYMIN